MEMRKLRRVGNSLVLTVSASEARRLGLAEGDLVHADLTPLEVTAAVRPELRAAVDRVIDRCLPALLYLRDR
jgi:antitoxin component of MazEF toxin-antitoxin module